ncbi:hypothetical protein HY494_02465 [Candidatus Woesearchaeota archaeon]|nr:hypothetical protein [Candidatus Woesearchaeota archaeon]
MVSKKRGGNNKARAFCYSKQPNVWIVLSVALIIVFLTAITMLESSSITGNTVQTIGYMNKGDTLQLSVRDVPGLETIFTHADEIIKNGKITAEVDDSIPFDRPYVVKFRVSSEGKFGPMQFQFKIKEQDLLDKGISRNDLRLYQELKEYSLQLLKVNHGYLYYLVTVPSMGHFVLGRVEAVETAVVVGEEKVVEVPTAEEQPVEVIEETAAEPLVVVGKAAEQPAPEMGQKGFFARIVDFFRNLFS